MALRGQLKSVRILLEEARRDPRRLRHLDRVGLIERLVDLIDRVERTPHLSAVRQASIALHNLIGSLRRSDLAEEFDADIDVCLEALGELLADATFVSPDELRAAIEHELEARGIRACPVCGGEDISIEPSYVMVKPMPSDPDLVASRLPCALVTCRWCGMLRMHDLSRLGVV